VAGASVAAGGAWVVGTAHWAATSTRVKITGNSIEKRFILFAPLD
jgi:hypothetical protein